MVLMKFDEEIDRKQGSTHQIAMLDRSLDECEVSWQKYLDVAVPKPVAESLRKQIAEKERSLAEEDSQAAM
jgi:hypothetical protein